MKTIKFKRENQNWELPDTFYRVGVKLIVKNSEDKLLVLLDGETGVWELPGGGIDHGEGVDETARREVREELGVNITDIDATPSAVALGEHPDNYLTVKMYYKASFDSFEFTFEDGFSAKYVDRDAFLALEMPGDESPIKQYVNIIWPF